MSGEKRKGNAIYIAKYVFGSGKYAQLWDVVLNDIVI